MRHLNLRHTKCYTNPHRATACAGHPPVAFLALGVLLGALCLWTLPVGAQSPTGPAGRFRQRQPQPSAERAPVEEQATAEPESHADAQDGLPESHEQRQTAIVGVWLGTSAEGYKLLATYNADGTLHGSVQSEVSTNPEFGVLTPVHGVWKYVGGRTFSITALGVIYDINTGNLMGYLKVRALLRLNPAGDEISGTDHVQLLDPDGNVAQDFPPGNTPYKRIKFEPFN